MTVVRQYSDLEPNEFYIVVPLYPGSGINDFYDAPIQVVTRDGVSVLEAIINADQYPYRAFGYGDSNYYVFLSSVFLGSEYLVRSELRFNDATASWGGIYGANLFLETGVVDPAGNAYYISHNFGGPDLYVNGPNGRATVSFPGGSDPVGVRLDYNPRTTRLLATYAFTGAGSRGELKIVATDTMTEQPSLTGVLTGHNSETGVWTLDDGALWAYRTATNQLQIARVSSGGAILWAVSTATSGGVGVSLAVDPDEETFWMTENHTSGIPTNLIRHFRLDGALLASFTAPHVGGNVRLNRGIALARGSELVSNLMLYGTIAG